MASFTYTAKTAENRMQNGTISAPTRAAAIKSLVDHHLTPVLVKESGRRKGDLKNLKLPFLKPKVKTKDLVIMTRQLATMVNAGVPIVRSLQTLHTQTESVALKETLTKIIAQVEDGQSLSAALAQHPKAFSVVYINMIKAGEAGGILDQILDRLAFQLEKDHDMKGKIKGAMIYPAVIMCITFGAFIFLMTGIVPKLKEIFDQFGADLPLNTRVMLAISGAFVKYGVFMAIAFVAGVFLLIRLLRKPKPKKKLHKLILKMPILGQVALKISVARFSRTFSSLTSAGVSVLDGLNVTADAMGNVIIKEGLKGSAEKVKNGQPISDSIDEAQIFPPIVSQMIAVGEETGQVDKVLEKVADFYEKEVDRVINSLTSIMEPFLIVFLGGLVGLIIASVFGPIANLTNVVE